MLHFLQALVLGVVRSFDGEPENELEYHLSTMKRLTSLNRAHLFASSNIMPLFRKRCGCDADGIGYWQEHPAGVNFDCCPLHRSLKQAQLEIDSLSERASASTHVRTQAQFQQRAQDQIRNKVAAKPSRPARPNGNQPRQFMAGDADSLCFQLALIEERLKRMIMRKELTAMEAARPRALKPRVSGSSSHGPIDIWYELAEDVATPPVMLGWLTNHGNPYIASRAVKTLGKTKKSA
jgi:hypothetical protein